MPFNFLHRTLYRFLRRIFRALPLSDARRDRLRGQLLGRYGNLVPAQARGRPPEGGDTRSHISRPMRTADEPAIGHVPYRKAALPSPLPAKLVAFHLPQFHVFAENDAWWGKGFTEWRNVTRALPQFEGHAQPRLPADLGFYDLSNPRVMRDQARLAAEYGIGAFCFYFYWFNGRTLMEAPLRQWLMDDGIELQFCLCWANENWTRRWDGRDGDVLIGQLHSAEDDLAFISHIAPYLRDRRVLKVDDKPMLLVYRPHLLPDPRATAQRWRQWCHDHAIGEIHLAYVQGFERPDPRDIGFDAAVEFPPNMSNPRCLNEGQWLLNPDFAGDVRDWRELARESASRPLPDYPLYPGVNPGWDNEPRRPGKGRVYLHASPRGYRDWLRTTVHERLSALPADRRLVFINAWNEWAEGAVLEPDARLGHAWLEATRRALSPAPPAPGRPCAIIHAWYPDVFDELLQALSASRLVWRIVVTTSSERQADIERIAKARGMEIEVHAFANHGRDILPFLQVADRLLEEGEDVVLKLHTKQSLHRRDGEQWRNELTGRLLAPDRASKIIQAFGSQPNLGLVAPEGHVQPLHFYWGANERNVRTLLSRFGIAQPDVDRDTFIAGSMFWGRLAALRPIFDTHLQPSLFDTEAGQVDGTLAHAIERIFSLAAHHAGFKVTTAAELLGIPFNAQDAYAYAQRD
ncbi:glycoside hydrolase family 99-like domain-containing protein [Stenotrophomonas sp. NLF4-10]|uniref:glycoside hydrolase family 99-like domain-containing protein n=1 Tax=Stenotrophomonas sp. NLF4-10 TaxID=2918754 RepID=UPI001EFAA4C2|nr:glycoside hydrolase family 99-like domain-containing protein [Stenotrophomonas sp. NLF4-10]MCG8277880.1 glycoside hydrolase family 99-like domain-containing protein [Stenotrophomonas sp. NLF4-10]